MTNRKIDTRTPGPKALARIKAIETAAHAENRVRTAPRKG